MCYSGRGCESHNRNNRNCYGAALLRNVKLLEFKVAEINMEVKAKCLAARNRAAHDIGFNFQQL